MIDATLGHAKEFRGGHQNTMKGVWIFAFINSVFTLLQIENTNIDELAKTIKNAPTSALCMKFAMQMVGSNFLDLIKNKQVMLSDVAYKCYTVRLSQMRASNITTEEDWKKLQIELTELKKRNVSLPESS